MATAFRSKGVRLVALTDTDVAALRTALDWAEEAWEFAARVGLVDSLGGSEQERTLPLQLIAKILDRYDESDDLHTWQGLAYHAGAAQVAFEDLLEAIRAASYAQAEAA